MQPGLRSQCSHILAGLQRRADGCWPLPSLMPVPTVAGTRHRPARPAAAERTVAPNGDPWYTMMAANKIATLQLR